jgi:hypothetical protein
MGGEDAPELLWGAFILSLITLSMFGACRTYVAIEIDL